VTPATPHRLTDLRGAVNLTCPPSASSRRAQRATRRLWFTRRGVWSSARESVLCYGERCGGAGGAKLPPRPGVCDRAGENPRSGSSPAGCARSSLPL